MGRALLAAAALDKRVNVTVALEHAASPLLGQNIGGHVVGADIDAGLVNADVLIDFTRPEGTLAHLAACANRGVNAVIGTTGFSEAEKLKIAAYAKKIAIVFAPNMSIGVNVTMKLVALAAKSFGTDYDIEVFEAHHKMKMDVPSGTALKLGEIAAEARGQSLADVGVYDRHGTTGTRQSGDIGFSVVRAGDIIGDHTVFFAGAGERVEITHKSSSRENYAEGAMRAATFLADKKTGLFDMQDVLGLK
jgi:4-hydroxy-tetrahydrodipicolinate reductase